MRRARPAEGSSHEAAGMMRWLLTYADMITLLLVFFIVLYAVSQVNQFKYQTLIRALHEALRGERVVPYVGANPKAVTVSHPASHTLQKLKAQLQGAIAKDGDQANAQVVMEDEGIRLTFEGGILFAEGKATILPQGKPLLRKIGGLLAPIPNRIVVEGYTDNLPIHTARFRSNWDLAAIRATTVLTFLITQGVPPGRFAAEAFGSYRPVATNATKAGRQANRRVDLVILKTQEPTEAPPAPAPPAGASPLPKPDPIGSLGDPIFPMVQGATY